MSKEFGEENKSNINNKSTSNLTSQPVKEPNPFENFKMPFTMDGNEEDYLKEMEQFKNFNFSEEDLNNPMKMIEKMMEKEGINLNKYLENIDESNFNNDPIISPPVVNTDTKNKTPSNPFVDTFREMKNNQGTNPLLDLLNGLKNMGGEGGAEGPEDLTNLFSILEKLSEQKEDAPQKDEEKNLTNLFDELLAVLLNTNFLSEPLEQIKAKIVEYLEKKIKTV